MSDPVLELDGVEKTYNKGRRGEVQVLRGVTLTIGRGEVVALVAPSGAGKSTLLHIAGLLDTPDSGRVTIDGMDMTRQPDATRTAARRSAIGFIYQFHHLLPEFSAAENIVLPQLVNGVPTGDAQARARMLLERVGLGARATHRPAALSGGEQQRVAFCRALANSPALLLADEPTGNLDSATTVEIMALFDQLHAGGQTIIIVTHEPEIAQHCHRVVRLRDGLVEYDRLNERQ